MSTGTPVRSRVGGLLRLLTLIGVVLTSGFDMPCYAHGFVGPGWLHPLTGPDHMLAMLAIGAWSAQRGGAALYTVPSLFVASMAAGGVAGLLHWTIAGTELLIALSVLGLGLAIALESRLWLPIALALVAVFGLAHGYAHGSAMPTAEGRIANVAGFLATTAGLHIVGAVAGLLALEHPSGRTWLRSSGALTAVAGVAFLVYAA